MFYNPGPGVFHKSFNSCGDGECVSISVLCDNRPDCRDQTDENCCTYKNVFTFSLSICC